MSDSEEAKVEIDCSNAPPLVEVSGFVSMFNFLNGIYEKSRNIDGRPC